MPVGSNLIDVLKGYRFPISRVLTGFFLLLAVILVAGVGVTVYPWLDGTISDMEEWYIEHEADEVNTALQSFFHHYRDAMRKHAQSPVLAEELKSSTTKGLIEFLGEMSILGHSSQFILLDRQGEILHATYSAPLFEYQQEEWFISLSNGALEHFAGISQQEREWFWRFAEPVFIDGIFKGSLVAEVPIAIINEDQHLPSELDDGYLELVYNGTSIASFGHRIDAPAKDFPSDFPGLLLRYRWDQPELEISRSALPLKISAGVTGIILLLLLTTLFFVRRYFVQPLEQFRDLAHSLAADSGAAQVPVEQPLNELVLLAVDFNTMATQIKLREQALKDARDNLEVMVREQTRELRASQAALKIANETLEEKVEERGRRLAEVQSQMVLQEKMASIGQLAAGIAHELNNPIHFVSANFDMLQECVDDFRLMLQEYRSFIAGLELSDASRQALESLKEKEEVMQLSAALDDLDQLFEESREGFQRISWIIKSMRDFSRTSQSGEFSSLDLNKGITDSLMIAKNEYKYHADVITEYGKIPHISCIPQQINQVILNLIVNAAQSIDLLQRQQRGEILIRTWTVGQYVCCSISDDGAGIPEELRTRIFEPFFTTKDAGKGTGLGLSISYDIVVLKHGGSLSVDCPEAGGSVFTIRLPIHQLEP